MAASSGVALMENSGAGNGSDKSYLGGPAIFSADATFGGGSVKLQIKLSTGTYADISSGSLSAAGISGVLYLPPGTYRAVATTATAVYAYLQKLPY